MRGSGKVRNGIERDWLAAIGYSSQERDAGDEEGGRVVPWRIVVVGRCGSLGRFGGYKESSGRPARIGSLCRWVSARVARIVDDRRVSFVVASGRTRIGLDTGGGASNRSHRAHVNTRPLTRFTYGKVDSMSITCRLRATLGRHGCTGWPVGPFDDYLWIHGKIWGEGVHGTTVTTTSATW